MDEETLIIGGNFTSNATQSLNRVCFYNIIQRRFIPIVNTITGSVRDTTVLPNGVIYIATFGGSMFLYINGFITTGGRTFTNLYASHYNSFLKRIMVGGTFSGTLNRGAQLDISSDICVNESFVKSLLFGSKFDLTSVALDRWVC